MLDESPDAVKSRDGSRFLLTLFGKHPAWDDHMEDIGIDTPSLADFKRWLYVDGIRTNLDSGAWEQMPEDHRVPLWDHRLLMTGSKGMILARLWASSDGRGRRAYPMIAATHLPTSRLPADLAPLFEALDGVKQACIETDTQEGVRDAARQGSVALESAVKRLSPLPPEGPSAQVRMDFLDSSEMGPARTGFERVLHVLSSDLAAFSPSAKVKQPARARAIRIPVPTARAEPSLLLWHAFFSPHLRPDVIWTTVHPVDAPWADIIVGGPEGDSVFRFRASSVEIPPVTDIPYNIPPETLAKCARIFEGFTTPPFRVPPIAGEEVNESGGLGSFVGRLFRGGS
jgi:hypothetical protein